MSSLPWDAPNREPKPGPPTWRAATMDVPPWERKARGKWRDLRAVEARPPRPPGNGLRARRWDAIYAKEQ